MCLGLLGRVEVRWEGEGSGFYRFEVLKHEVFVDMLMYFGISR